MWYKLAFPRLEKFLFSISENSFLFLKKFLVLTIKFLRHTDHDYEWENPDSDPNPHKYFEI